MILKDISAKQGLFLADEILYSCDGSSCYKSNREGEEQVKMELDDLEGAELCYNKETLVYKKSNKIKAIYLPTQRVVLEKEVKESISSFCISPSGMNVSLGFTNGKTMILNNLLGDSLGKFSLFSDESAIEHIGFLDDEVMFGATQEKIVLISLLKKGAVARITSNGKIQNIYSDEDRLLYTTQNNEIYFVDLNKIKNPQQMMLGKVGAEIKDVKFSNKYELLVVATKSSLFLIDIVSQKLTLLKNGFDSIKSISLDESDTLYVVQENSVELMRNPFEALSDVLKKKKVHQTPKSEDNTIRFLTVDDSKIIRLIIKKSILNNFKNVEVEEAEDGIEALSYLSKHPNIDVMFLDWNMPNMNGDVVVEEMAKRPELKHIKIIMATTEGGKDRVKQMISKGVTGYLVKPLTAGNVNPLTEKMIEIVQQERAKNV